MDDQELKLSNFNGPFDVLLTLVKDHQMDILSLDLVELANEYIKLIEVLKDKEDMDTASEYLVMSATLLQLKARTVLENPNDKLELAAEKKDILKQLAEYQQYKNIAAELKAKSIERQKLHDKPVSSYSEYEPEIDETKLDGRSDAVKLIMQMRKMFERVKAAKLRQTTIETIDLSPAERRLEVIEILRNKTEPTFEEIFTVPTIGHFVITMLTVLDMARKQELIIEQDSQFEILTFRKGVINE